MGLFGDAFDFNNDGEFDASERALDYMIYEDITDDNGDFDDNFKNEYYDCDCEDDDLF